jgi:hypothetical protein
MMALWLLLACEEDRTLFIYVCDDEDEARVEPTTVTANGLTAEEVIAEAMANASQLRIDWIDGLEPATTTLDVTWTAEPTEYLDWTMWCHIPYIGVVSPVAARFTDEQGTVIAEGPVVVGQTVADDKISDTLFWVDLPATLPSDWPTTSFEPKLRTHWIGENREPADVVEVGIIYGQRECLYLGCVTWVQ